MFIKNFAFLALALSFAVNTEAFAHKNPWNPNPQQPAKPTTEQLPECLNAQHQAISDNNNEEVIRWKTSTKNQYLDRALVTGKFVKLLVNKTSHLHFDMELNAKADSANPTLNHLEVVYNREFGDIANIRDGAVVVACGDFINSFAQAGRYPPSPVGAIIHWVHQSNNLGKHSNGFVAIDGVVYGDEGDAINGDSRGRGNQNGNQDDAASLFSSFTALTM
jgi:hypothetical protein